jgi:hypothetical protein
VSAWTHESVRPLALLVSSLLGILQHPRASCRYLNLSDQIQNAFWICLQPLSTFTRHLLPIQYEKKFWNA